MTVGKGARLLGLSSVDNREAEVGKLEGTAVVGRGRGVEQRSRGESSEPVCGVWVTVCVSVHMHVPGCAAA